MEILSDTGEWDLRRAGKFRTLTQRLSTRNWGAFAFSEAKYLTCV